MNIEDLIPKLLEATQKKKLVWREPVDNVFITKLKEQRFQITQNFDEDNGETFYRFSIYVGGGDTPHEGRFIDAMYADRFKGPFSDLEEIYVVARRSALGLDKVISDIDDELDELLK